MYRAKKLYKKIDTLVPDSEIWPVCIPSYNRPNASALRRLYDQPGVPVYLFVRKEQYEDYKHYADRFHIVKLNNVHDIGETRNAIVRYCWRKGMSNIFMLDDDIDLLDFIMPSVTSRGTPAMRPWSTIKGNKTTLNKYAFKMWQYLMYDHLDKVMVSGPHFKRFCWSLRYADAPPRYNVRTPIQCVHLNLDMMKEYNINYLSNDVCGVEDYALIYAGYTNGLRSLLVPDITYSAPAVGSGEGGCDFSQDTNNHRVQLFMKNVVRPEDAHKFTTKISTSGMYSVKFKTEEFRVK